LIDGEGKVLKEGCDDRFGLHHSKPLSDAVSLSSLSIVPSWSATDKISSNDQAIKRSNDQTLKRSKEKKEKKEGDLTRKGRYDPNLG